MKNFKRHPKNQHLFIKNDGSKLRYMSEVLEIIDHESKPGNFVKVVSIDSVRLSVNKLILETYGEPKPEGRHFALPKDGNKENLHPNNLYWSKSLPENIKASVARSSLSFRQIAQAHELNTKYNVPKTLIGEIFETSAMSITRAVRRYERLLKSKENRHD